MLGLHKKSEICNPNTEYLLNGWPDLIVKCRHGNKYLFCNYKSKNKTRHKASLAALHIRSWRLVSWKFMRNMERIITILHKRRALLSNSLMRKFFVKATSTDFWAIHMKIWRDVCLPIISTPGHCMKELKFFAKP